MNTTVKLVFALSSTGVVATLPTGSNVYDILNTYTLFLGTDLATLGISRIQVEIKNDQAATLKLYKSEDGSTFDQVYGDQAVTAPASGAISGPIDFPVDGFRYVKLTWTNGGSDQTVARGLITFVGDRALAA